MTVITNNKRACPYTNKGSAPKKRKIQQRTVLPASTNVAACTGHLSPSKLDEAVQGQGKERIQMAGVLLYTYYGIGVRSDGSIRHIRITISGCRTQVGEGSKKEHAAHPNAFSGVMDNYRKCVIEEAKTEQELTPGKRKFLSKLLTPEAWQTIQTLDLKDPNVKIEKYIPRFDSIIENSELELLLNGTRMLPVSINLRVDKPLENKLRSFFADLLEDVSICSITPDEALVELNDKVIEVFGSRIKKLEPCRDKKSKQVKEYTELELKGTEEQDLQLVKRILFDEFKTNGVVDPDKTIRLIQHR